MKKVFFGLFVFIVFGLAVGSIYDEADKTQIETKNVQAAESVKSVVQDRVEQKIDVDAILEDLDLEEIEKDIPVEKVIEPIKEKKKEAVKSEIKNNSPNTEVKYYTNTAGNKVQSPTHYNSKPAGASAKCKDGAYSFSQSRRGTCSGHGGVAVWY